LTSAAFATAANAQYAKQSTSIGMVRNTQSAAAHGKAVKKSSVVGKTTAATFFTENFGTGSAGVLPSGWTAAALTGPGTWHWTNVASTSAFTMGAMASTTAANGWMIFDSDSLGTACSCAPSGYLQSPAINCSAHTTVRLNFENYFRKFNDSCSVWVSTSPSFSSYSVYPVTFNNSLGGNVSTANPSMVHLNISGAAASQPTVYIRFVYYGYTGGSYSWMIDDMSLAELDPVDASLEKGAILYYGGTNVGFSTFGTKPLKMVDTVFPITFASNLGATALTAAPVNAKIFQGATSVYDYNQTVDLPVNAVDSLVNFGTVATYLPTAKASYIVGFNIAPTGDADPTNNVDSTRFAVTDSTWSQNAPNSLLTGSYYVHRPSSSSGAAVSFTPGTKFDVAAGHSDTLTSVSVSFGSTTTAGSKVAVQIYHFEPGSGSGGSWIYDGTTTYHNLGTSEISTSTGLVYATFPIDVITTGGQIVLDGGSTGISYAAVVKGDAVTGTVLVNATENAGPSSIIGFIGVDDTSANDGNSSQGFGNSGLPSGLDATPMVRLNFGKVNYSSAVQQISSAVASVGGAYPNPANNTVNIPVTVGQDATLTVTLSNLLGQVVKSTVLNANSGQTVKATFTTGELASGVYLYTVEANGQRTTGRVSVAH
jgi:hypothetical protein